MKSEKTLILINSKELYDEKKTLYTLFGFRTFSCKENVSLWNESIIFDHFCPINSKNHGKATRWEYSSLGEIFRNRRKTISQVFYV